MCAHPLLLQLKQCLGCWLLAGASLMAFLTPAQAQTPPTTSCVTASKKFDGMWFKTSEPGYGFTIVHQADKLFVAWFTHDGNNVPIWYVASDVSKQVNGSFMGRVYRTRGIPVNQLNGTPATTNVSDVGEIVFTFTSVDQGTVKYSISDNISGNLVGEKQITRFVFALEAPVMRNTITNTCITAPAATGYTWNSIVAGGVWVADAESATSSGTLVVGANLLPAASVTIGDAAWLAANANGTIKYVSTPRTLTGLNSRPIIWAYYKTTNGVISDGVTEYYATTPMYADTVATSAAANQSVGNGTAPNVKQSVKGSANGVKFVATDGCFEFAWDGANFTTKRLGNTGCSI